ncbi:Uncharacterised protein [Neisseria gonorrhoeae]|uniref:Uncharacterized protein n=1 Tax=Neisseria gonorrhoeae TaxID=485 RepID=A0A378W483_NEIGO|nr:Uncharacterised protein [Neisseria gonorrhoeae]
MFALPVAKGNTVAFCRIDEVLITITIVSSKEDTNLLDDLPSLSVPSLPKLKDTPNHG